MHSLSLDHGRVVIEPGTKVQVDGHDQMVLNEVLGQSLSLEKLLLGAFVREEQNLTFNVGQQSLHLDLHDGVVEVTRPELMEPAHHVNGALVFFEFGALVLFKAGNVLAGVVGDGSVVVVVVVDLGLGLTHCYVKNRSSFRV